MPPEIAVLESVVPGDEHEQAGGLIDPSAAFSQSFIRSAIAERPWAIKRSWLAMMLRAESLPIVMPKEPAAAVSSTNFERIGGVMMASAAVIPVHGPITQRASFWSWLFGGASIDELRNAIRGVSNDPTVSAIILDIDSPGGSVDGLTEFAAELRSMRGSAKPIVSVMDPLCASAAYWIGSQVDEMIATPSAEVGSIGVYCAHEDDSAALALMGVKITLISAGPYKTEGNPFEPLGDAAKAAMQDQIDTFYAMFLGDVAKGRAVSSAQVEANYGGGRTLLAEAALKAGMVDRIDTLEATALRLSRSPKAARRAADTSLISTPVPAARAASTSQPDRDWNRRMKGRVR